MLPTVSSEKPEAVIVCSVRHAELLHDYSAVNTLEVLNNGVDVAMHGRFA
jgi:hypothetical protein